MDIIKEIVETPALLKEIYQDLAKPGVKQAGKALSAVIGLGNTVLWPVVLLNEKARISLEKNLDKFREKMEKVPNEDVCEVSPEIGVPIAEKLAYVTNKELSDMYTELLAKASQKSKANVAHPGFVNAINNMSPDEAVLLRSIKRESSIPFIEVRLQEKGKNEWRTINPIKLENHILTNLNYSEDIHAYISNLNSLGFFEIQRHVFIASDDIYEPLEEDVKKLYSRKEISQFLEERFKDQEVIPEVTFKRGKIEVTQFAKLFMKACFES